MFSDKFTEVNNYSLIKKEYLNTSSMMPWRYTSIFDNQYLPVLDEEAKHKLQAFFYFRLQYAQQLLEDDKKYIEITHKDNQIQEFRAINPINLPLFIEYSEWLNFIHSIESPHLSSCYEKIFNMVKNSVIASGITSVAYDSSCNATGIYFQKPTEEFMTNCEIARKISAFAFELKDSVVNVKVSPDNDRLKIKISPYYPIRSFGFRKTTKKPLYDCSNSIWMRIDYDKCSENILNLMKENDLFTQEMIEYIYETIPKQSKFEIEYDLNETGEIEDIVLKNIIIEEFEQVASQQNLPIYDTLSEEEKYYEI
jgi:hypothetical protein